MGLSKANKKKLQIAQNKVIRFIVNLGPRTTVSQEELDKVGLLNVSNRAKQMILMHMFNVHHNLAPSYLSQNFENICHQYSTRYSQHSYVIPMPRGVTFGNFVYNGTKMWNDLPSWAKHITNRNVFKSKIRRLLSTQ
jgi:hypothetical protein